MSFLTKLFGNIYDNLWKAIIRPNRDQYNQKDLGLDKFIIKGKYYKRTDFSLINNRNIKLQCSFWEPFDEERDQEKMPCVIYLHGNCSSRCEAVCEAKYFLSMNICLFSFDFAGCGLSEGDFLSLGFHEKDDVHCIVDYLRKTNKVSSIGIWGRSMGAVTALMYCNEDPLISAMVIDSPFTSLNVLITELVNQQVSLPSFIFNHALKSVKESVIEKAQFNIDDIEPIKCVKDCHIPAMFCYGVNDAFVQGHHCKEIYAAYPGKKEMIEIDGDHNSIRPKHFKHSVYKFFKQMFYPLVITKIINHLPKTVMKKRNGNGNLNLNGNKGNENCDELNRITQNISNMINPLLQAKINMTLNMESKRSPITINEYANVNAIKTTKSTKPSPMPSTYSSFFDSCIVRTEDECNNIFLNNTIK